ncbi:MAG: hypothetical protein IJC45_00945 [Clostridia bacterium]|nr:hypothetical protein [Clostridia bacterium]
MKKFFIALVFVCLLLCCSCRQDEQTEVPTQNTLADSWQIPAHNGIPHAPVGSTLPDGSLVTSYSADGVCYYAARNHANGQIAAEFTYDTLSGTVLFRTDYEYEGNVLIKKISRSVSDKAYGYQTATGEIVSCAKIETYYDKNAELLILYDDFSGQNIARYLNRRAFDGSCVQTVTEYGRLRYARTYAATGALLFSTEYGMNVGMVIDFGGFGRASVASVGTDGSYTLLFSNRPHRMSDGTLYCANDLYVVVDARFAPVSAMYASRGVQLAQYRYTAADLYTDAEYYENNACVCRIRYALNGNLQHIESADGGDYFGFGAVTVGQTFGLGSVCEVNEDDSFTVVYFDRPYKHADGTLTENTTLYAYFDSDRRLAGNKYYSDGTLLAAADYYYYDSLGKYEVHLTEGDNDYVLHADGSVTAQ